jgi:hypothetical protein
MADPARLGEGIVDVHVNYAFLMANPGYGYTGMHGGVALAPFPIVLWHEALGHAWEFLNGGLQPGHRPVGSPMIDSVHVIENAARVCWNLKNPGAVPLEPRSLQR